MTFPDEPETIYYLATKDLRLATKSGGEVRANDAVYTKISYLATGTRAWKVTAKGPSKKNTQHTKEEQTAAKETAEAAAEAETVCVLMYDACVLTLLCMCPHLRCMCPYSIVRVS